MASQHEREMTLADGREVEVWYVIDNYGSDPSGLFGPPEDYDPGSGPELHIEKVMILPDMEEIEIDQTEIDRLEGIIAENSDWWAPDPEGPDDYRDDD